MSSIPNNDLSLLVFPSAARSGVAFERQRTPFRRGAHFLINVTIAVPGQTLTPRLYGVDVLGQKYPILEGLPITDTGMTLLKVVPGAPPIPNAVASDSLPDVWELEFTPTNADLWTYSVTANTFSGA